MCNGCKDQGGCLLASHPPPRSTWGDFHEPFTSRGQGVAFAGRTSNGREGAEINIAACACWGAVGVGVGVGVKGGWAEAEHEAVKVWKDEEGKEASLSSLSARVRGRHAKAAPDAGAETGRRLVRGPASRVIGGGHPVIR